MITFLRKTNPGSGRSMAVVIFIINPIIVFIFIRQNPFPLVFTCLKGSFITAFFTRSSAANIPGEHGTL